MIGHVGSWTLKETFFLKWMKIGFSSSSLHSFQSAHIIPLHSEANRYTNIPSGEIWFCSTKKILYIITQKSHYFTYSKVPRDQKRSQVGRWTQNVGGKTLGSLAILKQQSYIAMLPLTGTTRITTIFRIGDPNLNLHLPTVTKWGVRIPTHTKRIAQHPKWKQICRQCSLRHRRQDRQSGGREGPLCWVPYFQRSSWNCDFFLPETSWNEFRGFSGTSEKLMVCPPLLQVLGIFDTFAVKQQTLRQPKTTPQTPGQKFFLMKVGRGWSFTAPSLKETLVDLTCC